MILGLQIEILLYVRSLRESNFQLYVSALACFMKWFFAMDHYKYARWCSAHLFDLSNLEFTAPSLYEEFNTGNFSFQKTMRNFSSLAPDQVHEQNNEKIKGLGGAIHPLNRPVLNRPDSTGLEGWGTSGPELVCLLSEFEEGINRPSKSQRVLPHHEDTPAFQQQFTFDVRRVFKNFSCNPFEQEGIVKASNVNITYPEFVHEALKTLLIKGVSQFNEFWNS